MKRKRDRRWESVRSLIIKEFGKTCMKCGSIVFGDWLHVDHIKPKSKFPALKYEPSNLQILCNKCNCAKGIHIKDYRTDDQKQKFINPIIISKSLHKEEKKHKKIKSSKSEEELKILAKLKQKFLIDAIEMNKCGKLSELISAWEIVNPKITKEILRWFPHKHWLN